jgi:mannitol 2-dehydrogenase
MTIKLSLAALDDLPATIARPSYRREQMQPGIIHIGVGNFHRAHQAVYLDSLFNLGRDLDWALVGAGVRPGDAAMRTRLAGQDWLTTVVEMEPDAHSARVTGAMTDFLPVDPKAPGLVRAMSDPKIRIVSLTITEGGYCIDPATGKFNPDHPEIRADAARPMAPVHVFGTLVAALDARRKAGSLPFTVMSCDNIPGNGHVAKDAVVGQAALIDPDLAKWIEAEVAFPNSMVDGITPATGERERQLLQERFGIDDAWPVFCESWRQWVMEDAFTAGRPALEEVGVTFTGEVAAFELMKLRILNGGHAAIAYPAALLDIHFVHDAMADPLIAGFLRRLMQDEVIPILPPVPDTDLEDYLRSIIRRFSNPEVADTIPRLCQDGSNRQPKFILPSSRERAAKGQSLDLLALESAFWCRYCHGESEAGKPIHLDDVQAERLQRAAKAARSRPAAFLELDDIFGDLGKHPGFSQAFERALSSLWQNGVAATLKSYLGRT